MQPRPYDNWPRPRPHDVMTSASYSLASNPRSYPILTSVGACSVRTG